MKRAKKKKDNKVDYGTISLPVPLIDKIKDRIKGTGMNSVSTYVAFILRQVLSTPVGKGELIDSEKEKEIKKRLEILGY